MKPEKKPFWTWDIIALLALNLLFLGMILAACWALFGQIKAPLTAWLEQMTGL